MEPLAGALAIVAGLLLRLGVPLAVTAGAIWALRRLDARWQAEAERAPLQTPVVLGERCWEFRHCPPERVVSCPAYLDQSMPCWQKLRDQNGNLQECCLACQLFQRARVPVTTRPSVMR